MKVLLFGATGMVGQGVLRECLLDPGVERVLAVGRRAIGQGHDRLRELVVPDLFALPSRADELAGFDACFFCLGVSSAGMSEPDYTHTTFELTLTVARLLVERNPAMTFIYVSGAGTNERGRAMWARVKGRTESALLALPFKGSFMFRPGLIQPLDGIVSRTRLYRAFYLVTGPLYPALRAVAPRLVTNTREVGRAMLVAARQGAPKRILENADIEALAAAVG